MPPACTDDNCRAIVDALASLSEGVNDFRSEVYFFSSAFILAIGLLCMLTLAGFIARPK